MRSPPRFSTIGLPRRNPIHRIINAVAIPVPVAALRAHGIEGGEAAELNPEGGGGGVAPDEAREPGIGVEKPAREAQGQAHSSAARFQQVAEGIVPHRLHNVSVQIGKGDRRAHVVGIDEKKSSAIGDAEGRAAWARGIMHQPPPAFTIKEFQQARQLSLLLALPQLS